MIKNSMPFKKKHIPWNKGIPMSAETKLKLSKKLSNPSEETREKYRQNAKNRLGTEYKGKVEKSCGMCEKSYRVFPYLRDKNRYCSLACKRDWMSISFTKENHWNWKGGQKSYRHTRDRKYKIWRKSVFERDDYTCQMCNKRGVILQAHHIKGWSDYEELRYELNNGQTLCVPCHERTDNYKNKKRTK